MSVSDVLTFVILDPDSSFFGTRVYLENLQVKFVYQGHRVKVKVTVAKSVHCLPMQFGTAGDVLRPAVGPRRARTKRNVSL